jgi:soluble lytic murein transglycosylase-like protein
MIRRRSQAVVAVSVLVLAMRPVGAEGPEAAQKAAVRREIGRAAARHGVDRRLADAVAKVESGYKPGVVSAKGAVGVMQLMPQTARALGVDARDCRQNIDAGVRYLRALQERFGETSAALAAYNAGPGAVEAYGGVPPYTETRQYVERVLQYYGRSVETPAARAPGGVSRAGRRVPAGGGCAGTEVAFDEAGRMYMRARPVGPGCAPLR